jgi:hypothetical protein
MFVYLRLMGQMLVTMGAVFPGVLMVMHVAILGVAMLMRVFMDVFMGMRVGVFVAVDFALMSVRMAVRVGMLMSVQVHVFVFSFHGRFLPSEKLQVFHKPIYKIS